MKEYKIINGESFVPDGETVVSDFFEGTETLKTVRIPDSVAKIGDSAFADCCGLSTIKLPDSVTEIGEEAFYGSTGLTSIKLPESVIKIGMWAFRGCSGIKFLTMISHLCA